MNLSRKKSLVLLSVLCFLFMAVAYGCVPASYRMHPEFGMRSKTLSTLQIVPPDIKVYEISAGGVSELRDDWSRLGRENVLRAVTSAFKDKPMDIKTVTIDKDMEEELEDIQALYRAVITSIQLHTYGPYVFPEKQKNFDYSLGSVEKILSKYGTDALIFVYGSDQVLTGGRKAINIAWAIIAASVGVYGMPIGGATLVNIAIVDSSGTILWYNIKHSQGGHDVRNYEDMANYLKDLLSDFPEAKK